MSLIRYNPHHWYETPFDRLFSDFWPVPASETEGGNTSTFLPRVDIREDKEAILLSAEIPGADKEQVSVEVNGRVLTLSGEKKEDSEQKENGYYRSERSYGTFNRNFTLPEEVDAEKINASFENGVLLLTLPKKPEAQPRQIAIEGKNGDARQVEVS